MDGGKAGVDSGNGLAKHASRNTLNNAGERLQRPGAGGVVGGRGSGGASFGKEGGIERRGSERNNWQQGLDEFTRRYDTVLPFEQSRVVLLYGLSYDYGGLMESSFSDCRRASV